MGTETGIRRLASRPAVLVLADGTVFRGAAFGARCVRTGEVCFNTSMTGYQEIITDPSYAGQIVAMTYTQIGNVGVNATDDESGSAVAVRVHRPGAIRRAEQLALRGFARQLAGRLPGSRVYPTSTPVRWCAGFVITGSRTPRSRPTRTSRMWTTWSIRPAARLI